MSTRRTKTGRFALTSVDSISQVQFGHRQFPQIHVLPCGDWLVMFCWTDDAPFAKCGYLRSSDRGQTWSEGGWATDTGTLVDLGDNELAIFDSFYPLHKSGDDFAIQGCYSSDGGKSFGPVELSIPLHCPGAVTYTLAEMMRRYFTLPCFPWNRFFKANGYAPIAPGWPDTAKKITFGACGPTSHTERLDDGRLISMAYALGRNSNVSIDYYFAYALESTDRGRSWQQVGVVPWDPIFSGEGALFGNTGFTEAGLCQLNDGDLLIVLRAGSGQPMGTSRSSDVGRTWSAPEPIMLENTGTHARGVFPVLKKLRDGSLACVYGRPGIHLMTDTTGTGRHWKHEIDFAVIERNSCLDSQAPADFASTENVGLTELSPGELGVTYDLWGWQATKDHASVRQSIRLARLKSC